MGDPKKTAGLSKRDVTIIIVITAVIVLLLWVGIREQQQALEEAAQPTASQSSGR